MVEKSDFRLKSCIKGHIADQDKTIDPMSTVKKALARLGDRYDLSHLELKQRDDKVRGAYSFSSLSDQLNASGKGLTKEQSQASAIMEFLERYSWLHFSYNKYDGYTIKTINEIKQGPVRTVDTSFFFCNFNSKFDRQELLDELVDVPLKWIKGVSLMNYEKFYYPLNWYNYVFTSNGLATGNALEEAIVQALCEVIERENVYRFFGDKQIADDIDPESIANPLVRKVLRNAKKNGIRILIKDLSFDLKIPTFVAYGVCPADKYGLTYKGCGYGTHPTPEKAIIRALSEYFESYSLLKSYEERANINWGRMANRLPAKNYGFLPFYNADMLTRRNKVKQVKDIEDISRKDIKEEIDHIIKVLKKHKYEAILMNKTHPEIDIPVVRIFVPGFRNLLVSETNDPYWIMSEVCYEGGQKEASLKHLKQSALRYAFHLPEIRLNADPNKVFKSDYRETLLYYGSFKKDVVEILKQYEHLL